MVYSSMWRGPGVLHRSGRLSTFFRRVSPDSHAGRRTLGTMEPHGRSGVGDVKILIAEDDPGVQQALQRALRFEGYETVTASDGAEALDAVQRESPDALILDVMMPYIDGLETCCRLRSKGIEIPITARQAVDDRVEGPRRRRRRLCGQAVRTRRAPGPSVSAAPPVGPSGGDRRWDPRPRRPHPRCRHPHGASQRP